MSAASRCRPSPPTEPRTYDDRDQPIQQEGHNSRRLLPTDDKTRRGTQCGNGCRPLASDGQRDRLVKRKRIPSIVRSLK
jgi:hypothetical protein